jgi:hypothetical protein
VRFGTFDRVRLRARCRASWVWGSPGSETAGSWQGRTRGLFYTFQKHIMGKRSTKGLWAILWGVVNLAIYLVSSVTPCLSDHPERPLPVYKAAT